MNSQSGRCRLAWRRVATVVIFLHATALCAAAEPEGSNVIQRTQLLDFSVLVKSKGQPVADAEVDFGNGARLRADASGMASRRLLLPPLSPDSSGWHMAFTVRADGFATEEWAARGGVAAGVTTQVIELVPETIQTGRILGPDGLAIADAALTAVAAEAVPGVTMSTWGSSPPDRTAGTARSDATGMFAMPGLRAGRQYRLAVSTDHAGVSNNESKITAVGEPIDIVMGVAAPLTIALSGLDAIKRGPESDLMVVLASEADMPLIALELQDTATSAWMSVSSPFLIRSQAATGAEIVFSQVPVGRIRIVTRNVFGIAGDVSAPLEHNAAGSHVLLKLVGTHPLRLHVVDREFNPISGARVEFSSHTGRGGASLTTQADGVVTFQVHPAHDVKVTVALSGRVVLSANVRGSAEEPQLLVVTDHIRDPQGHDGEASQ